MHGTGRPAARALALPTAVATGLASIASDKDSLIHFSNPRSAQPHATAPGCSLPLAAAFLPSLTVTSSPRLLAGQCCC